VEEVEGEVEGSGDDRRAWRRLKGRSKDLDVIEGSGGD
jgi:hypothetical protein